MDNTAYTIQNRLRIELGIKLGYEGNTIVHEEIDKLLEKIEELERKSEKEEELDL